MALVLFFVVKEEIAENLSQIFSGKPAHSGGAPDTSVSGQTPGQDRHLGQKGVRVSESLTLDS